MRVYVDDPDFTLHCGDVLDVLRSLPDGSVHCCVTSPPYWGLRDYGAEGQLGLEPTPEEYVANMVSVFREVRRVLRADGTCWVNIGDSYAGGGRARGKDRDAIYGESKQGTNAGTNFLDAAPVPEGLKSKDLVGIPWRLAFALQADGWYLRADIIWAKPNPMPESVTDRPTKAHEYVFLMSKAPRYFFDQEAVRETAAWTRENNPEWNAQRAETNSRKHPTNRNGQSNGFVGWDSAQGRNIRSVWEIATQPYPEAHFATFPEALVDRIIRAGTSERGCCPECGAPWERETVRETVHVAYSDGRAVADGGKWDREQRAKGRTSGNVGLKAGPVVNSETTGWCPTCDCQALSEKAAPEARGRESRTGVAFSESVPCTVLDPFMGSGATALVARRLGRCTIGIELNPDYCQLAARRLQQLSLLTT